MKLRIHDNSIRLRLNRSEVARLRETGRVQDAVKFGSGAAFSYSLESSAACLSPHALFSDGGLRVIVPEQQARHWAASEEVGMEAQNTQPAILIEKDFQCTHREEHDPEAYPNPVLTETET